MSTLTVQFWNIHFSYDLRIDVVNFRTLLFFYAGVVLLSQVSKMQVRAVVRGRQKRRQNGWGFWQRQQVLRCLSELSWCQHQKKEKKKIWVFYYVSRQIPLNSLSSRDRCKLPQQGPPGAWRFSGILYSRWNNCPLKLFVEGLTQPTINLPLQIGKTHITH